MALVLLKVSLPWKIRGLPMGGLWGAPPGEFADNPTSAWWYFLVH